MIARGPFVRFVAPLQAGRLGGTLKGASVKADGLLLPQFYGLFLDAIQYTRWDNGCVFNVEYVETTKVIKCN